MNIRKKEKGFTIIEVVLVLAIAGLIFLMVFIALPALQRSQRDTQRKDDLSRMLTKLNDYTTNNRGGIPATLDTAIGGGGKSFVQNYLGGISLNTPGTDYQDPQAGSYTVAAGPAPSAKVIGNVYYNYKFICDVDGAVKTGSSRQYALQMFLEGQDTPYCVDNH